MSEAVTEAPDLIGMDAVAEMLNISRRSVQRYTKQGLLPQPVRLGQRYVRWSRQALLEWIEDGCKPPVEQEQLA